MFDLRNLDPSRLRNADCLAVAALAALVLTFTGGRAFAQEAASEAKPAAPPETSEAKPAAPPEASEPKPAAPAEAAKPEPATAIAAARPEAPPAVPPAPAVDWKVQSKGGFLMSSGNSQATNVVFGVNGSRKEGNNKLELEAGMAYGRSKNLVATTDDTGVIKSLNRQEVTIHPRINKGTSESAVRPQVATN